MMQQKNLYILRHAKAERVGPGQDDQERALLERGFEEARAIGKYMSQKGIRPDTVLCSTATRARETWNEVQKSYGKKLPVDYSDSLYQATVDEIMQMVAETPEDISSLLIVGHNPAFHELAVKLAKDGDKAKIERLQSELPTAALVSIGFDAPWGSMSQVRTTLKDFVPPHQLAEA